MSFEVFVGLGEFAALGFRFRERARDSSSSSTPQPQSFLWSCWAVICRIKVNRARFMFPVATGASSEQSDEIAEQIQVVVHCADDGGLWFRCRYGVASFGSHGFCTWSLLFCVAILRGYGVCVLAFLVALPGRPIATYSI